MKVQSLGHVVLKVSDQKRAEEFYNGLLGLPLVARFDSRKMSFFSLGDHHDFAVAAVGEDAAGPDDNGIGLQHVAFKIGDTADVLKEAKMELEAAGVAVTPVDHGVTQSLYFLDPDGNRLEVYVDVSDAWRRDPGLVAQAEPLSL
ncbi:MAG: VOC family protein [Alphaproteobacteria bacterium]|nr:VOC family protein [Alphaproteobacteria bacterium]